MPKKKKERNVGTNSWPDQNSMNQLKCFFLSENEWVFDMWPRKKDQYNFCYQPAGGYSITGEWKAIIMCVEEGYFSMLYSKAVFLCFILLCSVYKCSIR